MNKEKYQVADMEPVILRTVSEGGTFSFFPHGTSMLPTIRENMDRVILTAVPEKPKKYQIMLYKRTDGAYVLHRIVKVEKDSYTMRGDNQFFLEPGIKQEQMIAMVSGIVRDGHILDPEHGRTHIKGVLWVESVHMRRILQGIKCRCRRIYEK